MSDLFIAHHRNDRPAVDMLDRALNQLDFIVWFDNPASPSAPPQRHLKYTAEEAMAVIACLSPHAMNSYIFNRDATKAFADKALAPILVSPCTPPSRFAALDIPDLSAWNGELDHPEFQRLLRNLSAIWKQFDDFDLPREARLRARGSKSDIVALLRKILIERLRSHDEPIAFDYVLSELCKRAGAIGVDDVGKPLLEAALLELDAQNHRRLEPPLSTLVICPGGGSADTFRGHSILRLLPPRLAAEVHEECLHQVRACDWD